MAACLPTGLTSRTRCRPEPTAMTADATACEPSPAWTAVATGAVRFACPPSRPGQARVIHRPPAFGVLAPAPPNRKRFDAPSSVLPDPAADRRRLFGFAAVAESWQLFAASRRPRERNGKPSRQQSTRRAVQPTPGGSDEGAEGLNPTASCGKPGPARSGWRARRSAASIRRLQSRASWRRLGSRYQYTGRGEFLVLLGAWYQQVHIAYLT